MLSKKVINNDTLHHSKAFPLIITNNLESKIFIRKDITIGYS